MHTIFTQLLIFLAIVAIYVLLWRARHEHFARIGNSWRYIFTGFACLLSGQTSNLVFRFLLQQGRVSADATVPPIAAYAAVRRGRLRLDA